MDSPETALAEALDAAANAAFDSLGRCDAAIDVAGHTIHLSFAGEALREQAMRAFHHIQVPESVSGEISIFAWDTVQSGVDLTPEVGSLVRMCMDTEEIGFPISVNPQGIFFYDRGKSRGYQWLQDAQNLDEGNKATPLRNALMYALADRQMFGIHAAALQSVSGGFLLCGSSGAGKSTTSLACARAGFRFAADDFCFLDMRGSKVTANSVFASGKVFAHRLPDLPEFASRIVNVSDLETEKAVAFLGTDVPYPIVKCLDVDAAIILASKGNPSPSLRPISPGEALVGLAPSTVMLFRSSGRHLAALRDFVARVPCFAMDLAADIEANPPAIEALVGSLKGTRAGQ